MRNCKSRVEHAKSVTHTSVQRPRWSPGIAWPHGLFEIIDESSLTGLMFCRLPFESDFLLPLKRCGKLGEGVHIGKCSVSWRRRECISLGTVSTILLAKFYNEKAAAIVFSFTCNFHRKDASLVRDHSETNIHWLFLTKIQLQKQTFTEPFSEKNIARFISGPWRDTKVLLCVPTGVFHKIHYLRVRRFFFYLNSRPPHVRSGLQIFCETNIQNRRRKNVPRSFSCKNGLKQWWTEHSYCTRAIVMCAPLSR